MIKKIAIFLAVVILQAVTIYIGYRAWNQKNQLETLLATRNQELTQSNLDLGRANTKLGEADVLIKSLDKRVQEEIRKRNATINMYADLEANYKVAKNDIKLKSQIITKLTNNQVVADNVKPLLPAGPGKLFSCAKDRACLEVTSIPFSYQDFRLTLKGDIMTDKFEYSLTQRFSAKFIETKLPNGLYNHYAELYELDDKGKKIGKLTLTKFEVVRSQEMKAHLAWFNPKIDIGVGYSLKVDNETVKHAATGELGVSLASYGLTDYDITWRFVRIAVAITTTPSFSLIGTPVQFNVGRHLKPFSNLWISPSVGYDFTLKAPVFSLSIAAIL